MNDDILDLADALSSNNDPPFKTFLLQLIRDAEGKHADSDNPHDIIYWQGRKDMIRIVLSEYLNDPSIAGLNAWYQQLRRTKNTPPQE